MTTTRAYEDFKNELKKIYEETEAENIAAWAFEKATGLQKWAIRDNPQEPGASSMVLLGKYLSDLLRHRPVQYVLQESWFYKRKFYVNEHVLIPRPETEELVEWIIIDTRARKPDKNEKGKPFPLIIDIGSGSGCISISLKKELRDAGVTAIDVSREALSVAEKNARDLEATVHFLPCDFLDESGWDAFPQYDIIVSNPPYIPLGEKDSLASNVRDFEPPVALFVPDKNPWIFYEKILRFAGSHLKENGKIYVEIHENYADAISSLFENAGWDVIIRRDIYGKERLISAGKRLP